MSSLKDAMAALKSVLVMQAQIEHMDKAITKIADDTSKLRHITNDIDKRLVRIETMVEMSAGRGAAPPSLPDR